MARALYAACLTPILLLPFIAAAVGISLALLLPFALLAALLAPLVLGFLWRRGRLSLLSAQGAGLVLAAPAILLAFTFGNGTWTSNFNLRHGVLAVAAAILVASAAWALGVWRNEALQGRAGGDLLRPSAVLPLLLAFLGCGYYVRLAPFQTEATVLSVDNPSAPAATPGFRTEFVLETGDEARTTLTLDRTTKPGDIHRLFVVPDPLLRGPPRYVYLGPKRS